MSGAIDLHALCVELLNACDAAVAASPGGIIDRAYVSPGPPPWDCSSLVVYAGGPQPGNTLPLMPPMQPMHRIDRVGTVNLVSLTVIVIRCCVPIVGEDQTSAIVDPLEIQAVAAQTNGDVWAIWNHLASLKRAGQLFAWSDRAGHQTREMEFGPAVALATSGGCAGWQIEVRVQLSGYDTLAGGA